MSQLIVRKKGVPGSERTMTVKSFESAASRRGWEIVSKVANEKPKSEVQKLMDQKVAERAAQQAAKQEIPAPADIPNETKKSPGRPKTVKPVENEA